jgi:hypothetical protein
MLFPGLRSGSILKKGEKKDLGSDPEPRTKKDRILGSENAKNKDSGSEPNKIELQKIKR